MIISKRIIGGLQEHAKVGVKPENSKSGEKFEN